MKPHQGRSLADSQRFRGGLGHRDVPSIRLLAAFCVCATLLIGCGNTSRSDDVEATQPASGASTAAPRTSEAPAVRAGAFAVPPDGPTSITEFPIPAGAEVVDLGPPTLGVWLFGISSPDSATTLDFYRRTLAAQGYTVQENVSHSTADIKYDLAFFGKVHGVVSENELAGGTMVTVQDEPPRWLDR